MEESKKEELVQVLVSYGIVAALFLVAAHIEYLFNIIF